MYAVIFRAETDELDETYFRTAARMRELATEKYGCTEFTNVTEGNQEISISYWASQEQIGQWKEDPEHKKAQELGRAKWYKWYQVQIVEIRREYKSGT
jgi:heme-degrading monooxygenase HmoA